MLVIQEENNEISLLDVYIRTYIYVCMCVYIGRTSVRKLGHTCHDGSSASTAMYCTRKGEEGMRGQTGEGIDRQVVSSFPRAVR